MAPALRIDVERNVADDVREGTQSSGIRMKESLDAYGVIDVRIPPHDPLPRIACDEDHEIEGSESEVILVEAVLAVTSVSGIPIAIAPSAASVSVLSSHPPLASPAARRRERRRARRAQAQELQMAPQEKPAGWGLSIAIFVAVLVAFALVRALVL
jgi:hypothetical protein